MGRFIRDIKAHYKAWSLDQLTKSEFFHEKLHEWGLLEVAVQIETVKGETLEWNLDRLGISEQAWKKAVHRGIKPVVIFAHPVILKTVPGAVGYYRMLSMVSQKSMSKIGLSVNRYEAGTVTPNDSRALTIAHRLNLIISNLVAADEQLNVREFDLWRGMAAGAQAQGSWQNSKGKRIETQVKTVLRQRLRESNLVVQESIQRVHLTDGRIVVFADEPDVAIYADNLIQVAIEVKGGIDTAAILERVGAAIKSLSRAREENPRSLTVLLIQAVSVTEKAMADLLINRDTVNHWFTVEAFLTDEVEQEELFQLIGV